MTEIIEDQYLILLLELLLDIDYDDMLDLILQHCQTLIDGYLKDKTVSYLLVLSVEYPLLLLELLILLDLSFRKYILSVYNCFLTLELDNILKIKLSKQNR